MDLQTSISSALAWGPVPATATLADWERLMRRAGAALHMQQWRMALGYQRQALAVALGIAHHPPAGREDDCVAALVVSHLNLAELSQEAAAPTESARLLCQAHATLLAWMAEPSATPALQQAAWRHSRETHAALLRHVAQHGPQADITRLLQASHPQPRTRAH
jgi:hypothetical protein